MRPVGDARLQGFECTTLVASSLETRNQPADVLDGSRRVDKPRSTVVVGDDATRLALSFDPSDLTRRVAVASQRAERVVDYVDDMRERVAARPRRREVPVGEVVLGHVGPAGHAFDDTLGEDDARRPGHRTVLREPVQQLERVADIWHRGPQWQMPGDTGRTREQGCRCVVPREFGDLKTLRFFARIELAAVHPFAGGEVQQAAVGDPSGSEAFVELRDTQQSRARTVSRASSRAALGGPPPTSTWASANPARGLRRSHSQPNSAAWRRTITGISGLRG